MKFQRIEDLRIDHDLTQNDIAKILSCQREVYRRYEKGSRQIPVDYLIKLANYYGWQHRLYSRADRPQDTIS